MIDDTSAGRCYLPIFAFFTCIGMLRSPIRHYLQTGVHRQLCVRYGLKGKTMERGGGPKRSYTGRQGSRGTIGELLFNKS